MPLSSLLKAAAPQLLALRHRRLIVLLLASVGCVAQPNEQKTDIHTITQQIQELIDAEDLDKALSYAESMRATFASSSKPFAELTYRIGRILDDQNNNEQAEKQLLNAERLFRDLNDQRDVGRSEAALADLYDEMEQIEPWSALLVESHEFTVDHRVIRQAVKIRSNVGESFGQVGAAPRVERDFAYGFYREHAVAVEFQLVCPDVSLRDIPHRQAFHGLDETSFLSVLNQTPAPVHWAGEE